MSIKRLSLSSPSIANRMKKYDSSEHVENSSNIKSSLSLKEPISTQKSTIKFKSIKNQSYEEISTTRHATSNVATTKQEPEINQQFINNVSLESEPQNTANTNEHNIHALNAVSSSTASIQAIRADQLSLSTQITKKLSDKIPVKKKKIYKSYYGIAIILLIMCGVLSIQNYTKNINTQDYVNVLGETVGAKDPYGIAEGNGNNPAEGDVSESALASYLVIPELPRYLKVPELNIYARVKHLGIDRSGTVDSPWNIHDVGWYNQSVKPGSSTGSSLFIGHVNGKTRAGVYKSVNTLSPGVRIEVENGSGEIITYEVQKIETIPLSQVDMSKILKSEIEGKHDMKMITSAGKYNSESDTNPQRTIVYTKRIIL